MVKSNTIDIKYSIIHSFTHSKLLRRVGSNLVSENVSEIRKIVEGRLVRRRNLDLLPKAKQKYVRKHEERLFKIEGNGRRNHRVQR